MSKNFEVTSPLTRTTKTCESFYKNSPLIFTWVQILINEVQTSIPICKMSSVNQPKTPRNIIHIRQIKNEEYIQKYIHGHLT